MKNTFVPKGFLRFNPWKMNSLQVNIKNYSGHQVDYYFDFLKSVFGDGFGEGVSRSVMLNAAVTGRRPCRKDDKSWIVVGMSCGEKERHKIPSEEWFVVFLKTLVEQEDLGVMFIGNASDEEAIDRVRAKLGAGIVSETKIGIPIPSLLVEIGRCVLGVAGTTGQGHLMAAAGLPILVLSGVTDPHQSGPLAERVAILRHNLACSPCYQADFRAGCRVVECMNTLSVTEGLRLAGRLLHDSTYGRSWQIDVPRRTVKSVAEIKLLLPRR